MMPRSLSLFLVLTVGCGARSMLGGGVDADAGVVDAAADVEPDASVERRCGLQPGAPWPVEGHDARRTNRGSFAGPRSSHVQWRMADGPYFASSSPTIAADGTIYLVDMPGDLRALTGDGTPRWKFPSSLSASASIGCDGTVYVAGEHRFDEDQHRWMEDLAVAISPLGKLRWIFTRDTNALRSDGPSPLPVVGGELLITNDGYYGVDGDGGSTFHLVPSEAEARSVHLSNRPAIFPNGIAVGSFSWLEPSNGLAQRIVAFSPAGTPIWVLVHDSAFISIADDGDVVLLSWHEARGLSASGEVDWSTPIAPAIAMSAPAHAPDGRLYFMSTDGVETIAKDHTRALVFPWPSEHTFASVVVDASGWVYAAKHDRVIVLRPDDSLAFTIELEVGPLPSDPPIGSAGLALTKDTLLVPTRSGLVVIGP